MIIIWSTRLIAGVVSSELILHYNTGQSTMVEIMQKTRCDSVWVKVLPTNSLSSHNLTDLNVHMLHDRNDRYLG